MEAKGRNGQIDFDGQWVTITRRGFVARATVGKGDKRIHVSSLGAVGWKPAGPIVNGFITFSVPGSTAVRSRSGNRTNQHVRDENSVLFTWQQRKAFEDIRAAIEQALHASRTGQAAPAPPPPVAPADARAQLQQLQGLHAQGLISDAEYQAKRAEVLRRI
jgi:hypothetical protein